MYSKPTQTVINWIHVYEETGSYQRASHHLRAFNKMADDLANIAMDTIQVEASDIPRLPAHWSPVIKSLQGEDDHWLDRQPDTEAACQTSINTGTYCSRRI
ncbi:unnamed protein product [Phytophthora fragariaefolia]|uniref:Unnamed protein product n=1 Tax=Phytophthora fragariaefolia TaxID=1490495 RepID=A0A9W6WRJ1_9STRA|nr:unnamed protein product [Phytophthora fragariaefolia]